MPDSPAVVDDPEWQALAPTKQLALRMMRLGFDVLPALLSSDADIILVLVFVLYPCREQLASRS